MVEFKQVANNDIVKNGLEDIEDKLMERGFIVSATGDSDADVSLHYEEYEDKGEIGEYLVIHITSNNAEKEDEDKFEEISDYVSEKVSDMIDGLPSDIKPNLEDPLLDIFGQIVLLNGRKVY
jgi:hypothetical protein